MDAEGGTIESVLYEDWGDEALFFCTVITIQDVMQFTYVFRQPVLLWGHHEVRVSVHNAYCDYSGRYQ